MFSFFHKNRIRNSFGRKLHQWNFEKRTKCEKPNVKTRKNNSKSHINCFINNFSHYGSSLTTTSGETPWKYFPNFKRHTVREKSITQNPENLKNRIKKLAQTKRGLIGWTCEMVNDLNWLPPWVR